jgi:hypothetical protein
LIENIGEFLVSKLKDLNEISFIVNSSDESSNKIPHILLDPSSGLSGCRRIFWKNSF